MALAAALLQRTARISLAAPRMRLLCSGKPWAPRTRMSHAGLGGTNVYKDGKGVTIQLGCVRLLTVI